MQTPQSTSQSTVTGGGDPVTPSAATSVETPPSLEAFLSGILVDTLNKPPEYLRDTLASFIEQDVATFQLLASLIGHTANFELFKSAVTVNVKLTVMFWSLVEQRLAPFREAEPAAKRLKSSQVPLDNSPVPINQAFMATL